MILFKAIEPNRQLLTIIAALLWILPLRSFAQEPSSYQMDFVRAGWLKDRAGQKQIVAVFKITPLIEDFQFILSMRVFYTLHGQEQAVDIEKHDNVRFHIYGNNVETKKPILHEFIKHHVDLGRDDIFLLEMFFTNLGVEPIGRMSITYGLWESHDDSVRHEQTFEFHVEDMSKIPRERTVTE
jgi:hypothetical protein